MDRLDKLVDQVDKLRTEDIPGIRIEIATLKTQARFAGAIAGAIPAIAAVILTLFRS